MKKESSSLQFLYHTAPGRMVLKVMTARWVSKLAGLFMDSPFSKGMIPSFFEKNHINRDDYLKEDYKSFNQCFTRKIRPELRPINRDPKVFMAPCDGLLSVYSITKDTVLPIKQSRYRVSDLLGGNKAAKQFEGGLCLVFRLCVDHYHRYCYLDNATKGDNFFIPGELHTVRPIALEQYPVFVRNCREYTLMETENFGTVAQIEVGAMLVGKIKNHHRQACVRRGQEKGMFLYGGSTIVVLVKKDAVILDEKFTKDINFGEEHPVKMGQSIGGKYNEKAGI